MGTNRLKSGQDEHAKAAKTGKLSAGTAPLKSEPGLKRTGSGRIKLGGTAPVKASAPGRSKYTTAQLRLPPSKRRRRWSPIMKGLALATVLLVGGGGAAVAGAHRFLDSLGPHTGKLSFPAMAEGLMPMSEATNVLILGADYSYDKGRRIAGPVRSDTIVVAGLDPAHHRATLISIPRDTRVYLRGHYDKINSALALGGPRLAAQVVSDLLGVPIHHWAQVNTKGLERIVDVAGGVDVYVEKDMRYVDHTAKLDINLSKGWHKLSGEEAHQFVRFRHDELGDIGRVRRQQQFLRAAAEQLLRPDTLLKVPQMLSSVQENVSTSMDGAQLMKLATWGLRLDRKDIKMVMLPGEFSNGRFAASYWLVDPAAAQSLAKRLLAGEATKAEGSRDRLKITVLNGTTRPGLASQVADKLREAGWNVYGVGDAPRRDVSKTQVITQTGHEEWSAKLAKDLGVEGDPVTASIGDVSSDFTVVIGDDFGMSTH